MPVLSEALATEGLWLLALAAVLGGLVRGFSGFGTAMIYLPFAGQVLEPVWVLITLLVIDLFGPLPAVPRALRDGDPPDILRLGLGALVGVPLGVLVLTALSPQPFRYAVSILTILLLVALVSGLRYRGAVTSAMVYLTGTIAGFLGGAVGLPGPPVILLYMARPLAAAAIRANTLLFLVVADVLMVGVFGLRGLFEALPLVLGFVLTPLYLAAVWTGSAIFDPRRGSVYRWVAYAIIAGSAIGGLPVWD